ncbi:hypothetical protein BKA65DRAFT_505018 [Rhexocercosporidium sp. MPI-PUGE-AT-0058]|nr:hypothetical protein BKA65DRAFT_505018 [Rhexocercosporidium sp. MPI-PUGE-AT-0058]
MRICHANFSIILLAPCFSTPPEVALFHMPSLHCHPILFRHSARTQDQIGEFCLMAAGLTVLGTMIRISTLISLLKEDRVYSTRHRKGRVVVYSSPRGILKEEIYSQISRLALLIQFVSDWLLKSVCGRSFVKSL